MDAQTEEVFTLDEYRKRFVNHPNEESETADVGDATTAEAEQFASDMIQKMVRQIQEFAPQLGCK